MENSDASGAAKPMANRLSEATLEKLIARGFIHSFADIYHLDRYRAEIVEMEGFGEKSYANLMDSIEKSRTTLLSRVVYALGIPNIGVANASSFQSNTYRLSPRLFVIS